MPESETQGKLSTLGGLVEAIPCRADHLSDESVHLMAVDSPCCDKLGGRGGFIED